MFEPIDLFLCSTVVSLNNLSPKFLSSLSAALLVHIIIDMKFLSTSIHFSIWLPLISNLSTQKQMPEGDQANDVAAIHCSISLGQPMHFPKYSAIKMWKRYEMSCFMVHYFIWDWAVNENVEELWKMNLEKYLSLDVSWKWPMTFNQAEYLLFKKSICLLMMWAHEI